MNANVYIHVMIVVQLSDEKLKMFFPKVRGGLKTLWNDGCVK